MRGRPSAQKIRAAIRVIFTGTDVEYTAVVLDCAAFISGKLKIRKEQPCEPAEHPTQQKHDVI